MFSLSVLFVVSAYRGTPQLRGLCNVPCRNLRRRDSGLPRSLAFLLFRNLSLQRQLRQDLPWEQSRIRCFSEPAFGKCIFLLLLVYRVSDSLWVCWGIPCRTSRISEEGCQSLWRMFLHIARSFLHCTPVLDPIPDLQIDASCGFLEQLR